MKNANAVSSLMLVLSLCGISLPAVADGDKALEEIYICKAQIQEEIHEFLFNKSASAVVLKIEEFNYGLSLPAEQRVNGKTTALDGFPSMTIRVDWKWVGASVQKSDYLNVFVTDRDWTQPNGKCSVLVEFPVSPGLLQ